MQLFDIAVVCGLLKYMSAKYVLEIGTFDGRTAVNLAKALPPSGLVTTVDLPPGPGSESSCGARLKFGDSTRIEQVLCDSGKLSAQDLGRKYDAVLIDGDHSARYVAQDTTLALSVLRATPDAFIVWDDVDYPHVLEGIRSAAALAGFSYWHVAGTRIAVAFPNRG
jgi:predicted O-methyltransferase YrrM